ncbi:hypothetical protein Prudu_013458 [Prunus dulcis]|uniref:Uncharacterized protein n=1 Tax=Prunus dulcis TaxID=3755 RepID=A0A4Y1REV3_PRUDU|nr:hypothetical protein Prudu_013458 [Prunus dulcis]
MKFFLFAFFFVEFFSLCFFSIYFVFYFSLCLRCRRRLTVAIIAQSLSFTTHSSSCKVILSSVLVETDWNWLRVPLMFGDWISCRDWDGMHQRSSRSAEEPSKGQISSDHLCRTRTGLGSNSKVEIGSGPVMVGGCGCRLGGRRLWLVRGWLQALWLLQVLGSGLSSPPFPSGSH